MKKPKDAEIFIFEEDFFFSAHVKIIEVNDEKLTITNTPLLNRFAILGKRVHLKHATFILPSKVIGKSDATVVLSMPTLNPEGPAGDRKGARVPPSEIHPVKLIFLEDGKEKEVEVEDVSEGGFSIRVNPLREEVNEYLHKDIPFKMIFPSEAEHVRGTARAVNLTEISPDRAKIGFEMFIDDADAVKVRFYVYSRVKEILKE